MSDGRPPSEPLFEAFYGLQRPPFHTTPDPEFLYLAPRAHGESACLPRVWYGPRAWHVVVLTGEVGVGKTTVLRAFLARPSISTLTPIYVFHPQLSFLDLTRLIADELGSAIRSLEAVRCHRQIQEELIERYTQGKRVVVFVDEAHRLPETTLEGLRLLSNLEAAKAKLLLIVLIGATRNSR